MVKHTRQRRNDRREPGPLPLLAAVLEGTADLAGAACQASDPRLFDPLDRSETVDAVAERHQKATAVCRRCPVIDGCHAWAEASDDQFLDAMVIAGRLPATPGRPRTGAA